jgi:hypothetical protein
MKWVLGRNSRLYYFFLSSYLIFLLAFLYVVFLKSFGEWYQKTNKTEDTNKFNLLTFKIIAILHNTLLTTFIKLLENVSNGLLRIDRRIAVTRCWITATSAKRAPFVMLFRRGNRKKCTHRTPLIWRLRGPD